MSKTIYVVTVTTGRRSGQNSIFRQSLRSLNKAISDYYQLVGVTANRIKHVIYLNCDDEEDAKRTFGIITQVTPNSIILFDEPKRNIGIASALNKCHEYISESGGCDLVLKMDDDVIIYNTQDFFLTAMEIHSHEKLKNTVFSPYPVGLINNPGGPPASAPRFVYKSIYGPLTFRPVNHIGGMCRFVPFEIFKSFRFNPDLIPGISGDEDGQLSRYCLKEGIQMCYLENKLVVEHAYSTLGQIVHDGDYFSGRSYEQSAKFEVLD